MMPSSQCAVLKEVRQMLARATPEQTQRLLSDIMRTAPVVKESV